MRQELRGDRFDGAEDKLHDGLCEWQRGVLQDRYRAEAQPRAGARVCGMVQGAGRSDADSDFEFAGGEPGGGVRVRHREALPDRAADDFAPFEDSAGHALRAVGAARDVYVLSREPELPG